MTDENDRLVLFNSVTGNSNSAELLFADVRIEFLFPVSYTARITQVSDKLPPRQGAPYC
jgi:hypothetical protein